MAFRLDKFYRPYTTVTLPATDEQPAVEVTVRALSDLERTARGRYMLDESSRTINRLKDKDSPEYQSWIEPLADATHEQLVDILVTSYMDKWQQEAMENHPVDFLPYPDNASDEEKVAIDEKQKQHETEVITNRTRYITDRLKAFREKALSWEDSELKRQSKLRAVYVYGAEAAGLAELHYTMWCAVQRDSKPHWESPRQVGLLPEAFLRWLFGVYREVDAFDPWALSKSESTGDVRGMGEEYANVPSPVVA